MMMTITIATHSFNTYYVFKSFDPHNNPNRMCIIILILQIKKLKHMEIAICIRLQAN